MGPGPSSRISEQLYDVLLQSYCMQEPKASRLVFCCLEKPVLEVGYLGAWPSRLPAREEQKA